MFRTLCGWSRPTVHPLKSWTERRNNYRSEGRHVCKGLEVRWIEYGFLIPPHGDEPLIEVADVLCPSSLCFTNYVAQQPGPPGLPLLTRQGLLIDLREPIGRGRLPSEAGRYIR
jgi:hypothetical protein